MSKIIPPARFPLAKRIEKEIGLGYAEGYELLVQACIDGMPKHMYVDQIIAHLKFKHEEEI